MRAAAGHDTGLFIETGRGNVRRDIYAGLARMSSLAGSVRAIFQANEKARTAATTGSADPRVASRRI